jgi:hypothetical protein
MAYVLLNISHQERRPRSDRAAFRILGVFGSIEDAARHSEGLPKDASIHLLPLRKWTPIMRREDCSDEEKNSQLIKLGEKHRRRTAAHAEEFAENVSKRQMGKTADATKTDTLQSIATCRDDPLATPLSPVLAIPRNSEVRMQHFAVVSIISDDDEPDDSKQEPAVLVWGVTETECAAKDLIKTDLADEASDVHLDVVAMYEWLYPTEVDPEQIAEEYRDARLDELMQHRKTESRRVASFRKKCAAEGYEAPLISLDNPLLTTTTGAKISLPNCNNEEGESACLTTSIQKA